MSKMGRFIESKIERGEFTVDDRGTYHVQFGLQDRERSQASGDASTHAFRQNEGGRKLQGEVEQTIGQGNHPAKNCEVPESIPTQTSEHGSD